MRFAPPLRPIVCFQAESFSCHQLSPHQKQVAEGEQRIELGPVLCEAAVAGLHIAKLAFNDTEEMLNLSPHLGDDAVGALLKRMQVAVLWGLAHDAPELARTTEHGRALGTNISFVSPDLAVVQLGVEVSRLRVTPLSVPVPMWAFIPKNQSLPSSWTTFRDLAP